MASSVSLLDLSFKYQKDYKDLKRILGVLYCSSFHNLESFTWTNISTFLSSPMSQSWKDYWEIINLSSVPCIFSRIRVISSLISFILPEILIISFVEKLPNYNDPLNLSPTSSKNGTCLFLICRNSTTDEFWVNSF